MYKFKKVGYFIKLGVGIPLLVGVTVALVFGNGIFNENRATIIKTLCPPIAITTEEEKQESAASGINLAREIVKEGSVLVKNDNDTLPLDKASNKKVNVFGHGSIDWIVGGSGSGQCETELNSPVTYFLPALQDYGITYNTDLATYYTNYSAPRGNVDSLNQFYKDYYKLAEPSLSSYSSLLNAAKAYSDTAFVVIGRRAGETEDPPRYQIKIDGAIDTSRHYLEISSEEEELLTYVGENFENVVVIINSTNCMELDFLDTIPGLDSCLIVGCTGNNGAYGVAELLYGEATPSGRTSDTYPYDFKYNINYNHSSGAYRQNDGTDDSYIGHYTNGSSQNLYPKGISRNAGYKYSDNPSYVDYTEGIYVGYKWFETADAMGYWDNSTYNGYENVVQFPFGYGQSYTSFDWELVSSSPEIGSAITNESTISLKIKVTNTGDTYSGKEVVEAYLTAPYTSGGIEKSYVSLVGTSKTVLLEPGQSQEVDLVMKARDFESYDCYDKNNNGHTGYELEAGEYQIKLMSDAHNIKQILFPGESVKQDGVLTYNVESHIDINNDEVTGNKVMNRFTGDNTLDGAAIDGSDSGINVEFISRNNFPALSQEKVADREISANATKYNTYNEAAANEWDNRTVDVNGEPLDFSSVSWDTQSDVKLWNGTSVNETGLKLGKSYDDADWDKVLDCISYDEAVALANTGNFGNAAINSVGKPSSNDRDGPAQVCSFNAGNDRGTGFPNSTVLAQSWSSKLAYRFGIAYANDMAAKGVDGAYAFGCNIHRSPFQGRNYEYLSEDGFLTGLLLTEEVKGLKNLGKYTYLKHLIVAETENEREAMYTWLTEQALREIYLKPFKMAVQEGGCVGIMTSYNRLGAQWSGSCEQLITGVLRYEWGFRGAIVTDYADHPQYMNQAGGIRAGGNLGMGSSDVQFSRSPGSKTSVRVQHRLKEAVKEVLFCHLSTAYAASIYDPSKDDVGTIINSIILESYDWVSPTLLVLNVVAGLFIGFGFYMVLRPKPIKEAEIGGK